MKRLMGIIMGAVFALQTGLAFAIQDGAGNDIVPLGASGEFRVTDETQTDVFMIIDEDTGEVIFTSTEDDLTAVAEFNNDDGDFEIFHRAGTPEGNITANTGDICIDSTNGKLYIKKDDGDNTDWEEFAEGMNALQEAYNMGNSITTTTARDIDITLDDTATDSNLDVDIATGSTSTVSVSRLDGAGAADPSQLLLVENLDTDRVQPTGLLLNSAAGGLTTAIDASDADIGDAINIGANDIEGTNFDVAGGSGEITVAAGAGLDSATAGGALDFGATNAGALAIGNAANTTTVAVAMNGGAGSDFTVDTDVLVVESDNNRVGVGTAAPLTTFHVDSNAANTTAIATLENTAGDVQIFRTDATPEAAVTGNAGDIAIDGTNGMMYIKLDDGDNTDWEMVTTGAMNDLQGAYDDGNLLTTTDARDIDFVLDNTTTDSNFDIDIATGSTSTVSVTRADGAGTADPSQLLLVENADTDRVQPTAVSVASAGGGITTAIDVSDSDIDDAINIGSNDIEGANFDVAGGSGEITVAAGAGLDSATAGGALDFGATNAGALAIGNAANTTTVAVAMNGGAGSDFTVDTDVLVVESDNNRVGVGIAAPLTTLHVDSNAANTSAIATLENTAGNVQVFRTDATPEGAVTGDIGDIAIDGTNGTMYIKLDDGDNTTWSQFASGTQSLQTSYVGGNTIDLSAGEGDLDVDGTGAVNALHVDEATANVGIGTDAPGTELEVNGAITITPSTAQSLAAATAINPNSTYVRIQGSGAGVTNLTADPQITAGVTGQTIIVVGQSQTNRVQLDNGNGLRLSGGVSFTLGNQDTITLIYDGTNWIELSRVNNPST